MPKVEVNTQAPDFTLSSFDGQKISLSDFRRNSQVLLVFNRGFA
jgi:peroxiredoxin